MDTSDRCETQQQWERQEQARPHEAQGENQIIAQLTLDERMGTPNTHASPRENSGLRWGRTSPHAKKSGPRKAHA